MVLAGHRDRRGYRRLHRGVDSKDATEAAVVTRDEIDLGTYIEGDGGSGG